MAPKLEGVRKDDVWSQYSTVKPLFNQMDTTNSWLSDEDRDRVNAYAQYEKIYWNDREAFRLFQRGADINPVYVPNPMTIVDTTAHYYMKGLVISGEGQLDEAIQDFVDREEFYSKFMVAKHSGVVRGDYLLHLTAEPEKDEGRKLSMTTIDPARYFPVYDDDDLDKLTKVHLAEFFYDKGRKVKIRRLTYYWDDDETRLWRSEGIYEANEKWAGDEPTLLEWVLEPEMLPETIQTIPVYHFKNRDWQGDVFGSSELRGYERVQASIDQTLSDEEVALALEGLGVYATDAGSPEDNQGRAQAWEISPARVMELPTGSYFNRVKGIEDVTPFLDHVRYLKDDVMEASATFRAGSVEASVAESGIALAIKFLPMDAKLQERDLTGVSKLKHFWHDWQIWHAEYEGEDLTSKPVKVALGDKLPMDRAKRFEELNNMYDRKIISAKFYRAEVKRLFGIDFPADIETQIQDEANAAFEAAQRQAQLASGNPDNPNEPTLPQDNKSNNAKRTNESNGSEMKVSRK